jgi:ribulose-5-phosphate 4-epimerase/fuculose-1-phosphate aldolase
VTDYDIEGNRVACTGPVQASSESLTHAAVYDADPAVCAVVHAHHPGLWRRDLHRLPTTRADAAYGTPAMAFEFLRLVRETDFARVGVAVMAGHDAGIVAIGPSPESAATRLLRLLQKPGC